MEDELQGMRGEERHFRGGRGRGIRGGGGPRGRKRRDLKPKEVMERERLVSSCFSSLHITFTCFKYFFAMVIWVKSCLL